MATPQNTAPAAPSLNLGDIYHVLFKHKWLILLFSLAGFGAAAFIYFRMPPPYQSEAMLLVKYVEEDKGPLPVAPGEIRQADSRGEGILAVETDILTSLDVADAVVDAIGAQKILGKGASETNRSVAAMVLRKNLIVETPKKGSVLHVTYLNRDPQVVQPVLKQVIDTYQKNHTDIHRSLGKYDDFLKQQSDEVRAQLGTTQEALRKLMDKTGMLSLDETKKELSERRAKLQDELNRAKTELAERVAGYQVLQKARTNSVQPIAEASSSTNASPSKVASAQAVLPAAKPSREVLIQYKQVLDTLDQFWKQDQELAKTFTLESFFRKDLQRQTAELQARKAKLEEENPGLLNEPVAVERNVAVATRDNSPDLQAETVRITALNARITQLNEQFDQLKADLANLANDESTINRLQLQKEIEENKYKSYVSSLDRARLEATLTAGKAANISEIQEPSPPLRDTSKFFKKVGIAAGGGIGGGLALAFLLELVLNQAVRKPSEIASLLKVPVFVSIPEFRNGHSGKNGHDRKLLKGGDSDGNSGGKDLIPVNGDTNGSRVAPWDEHHALHPYSEALRDRLVTFFELKGMTHKPKLVAVTSCARGAGVTSVAAGLAASLSETGEGNVLLVDMNMEQGAAHPFYKGKPACGLEDVLSHEKRGEAKINDKLYMVTGSEGDSRLPRILPKRFTHLLPKLQASDYDYIIFDMPPVTQTSVTPRLAALMDVVLLMAEAGKTNREVLKQASSLIAETKANLGVIFNRRRNYVPKWLHQEF